GTGCAAYRDGSRRAGVELTRFARGGERKRRRAQRSVRARAEIERHGIGSPRRDEGLGRGGDPGGKGADFDRHESAERATASDSDRNADTRTPLDIEGVWGDGKSKGPALARTRLTGKLAIAEAGIHASRIRARGWREFVRARQDGTGARRAGE